MSEKSLPNIGERPSQQPVIDTEVPQITRLVEFNRTLKAELEAASTREANHLVAMQEVKKEALMYERWWKEAFTQLEEDRNVEEAKVLEKHNVEKLKAEATRAVGLDTLLRLLFGPENTEGKTAKDAFEYIAAIINPETQALDETSFHAHRRHAYESALQTINRLKDGFEHYKRENERLNVNLKQANEFQNQLKALQFGLSSIGLYSDLEDAIKLLVADYERVEMLHRNGIPRHVLSDLFIEASSRVKAPDVNMYPTDVMKLRLEVDGKVFTDGNGVKPEALITNLENCLSLEKA